MLFYLYKIAGSLVVPPGLLCALLFIVALLVMVKRTKKAAGYLLIVIAVALWFVSTDTGANIITGSVEKMCGRELPSGSAPVTVLLLGGGNLYDDSGASVRPGPYALEDLFTALELLRERGGTLVVSGGDVFGGQKKSEADIFEETARKAGWTGRIIKEGKSRTTKENLMNTAAILGRENTISLVLVTSAFHMPRSMKFAKKYIPGIKVYPCPSPRVTDPIFRGISSLLPHAGAFEVSCIGIKERIGMLIAR